MACTADVEKKEKKKKRACLTGNSMHVICYVCAVSMPAPDEQERGCTLQARDASRWEHVRVTVCAPQLYAPHSPLTKLGLLLCGPLLFVLVQNCIQCSHSGCNQKLAEHSSAVNDSCNSLLHLAGVSDLATLLKGRCLTVVRSAGVLRSQHHT